MFVKKHFVAIAAVSVQLFGFNALAEIVPGDFNGNGMRDAADLDLLAEGVASNDVSFDLDGDGDVDILDRVYWVETLSNTFFGDANLDGKVDSGDFVLVFSASKYSTDEHALWAEGDWNGDFRFDSADVNPWGLFGGFEQGEREGGFQSGKLVVGDFNNNGRRDVDDLDLLAGVMVSRVYDSAFDLNSDGIVGIGDRNFWVVDLANTSMGDSNFDGEFDSGDFVSAFAAAKFETGQRATWSEGDWNGDLLFNSTDFVCAFSCGPYEQGPRDGGLMVVPEPLSLPSHGLAFGLFLAFTARRIRGIDCCPWAAIGRTSLHRSY